MPRLSSLSQKAKAHHAKGDKFPKGRGRGKGKGKSRSRSPSVQRSAAEKKKSCVDSADRVPFVTRGNTGVAAQRLKIPLELTALLVIRGVFVMPLCMPRGKVR